jgi:hypothetical protein
MCVGVLSIEYHVFRLVDISKSMLNLIEKEALKMGLPFLFS